MQVERHEAIGQRGEACIVVARHATGPNGTGSTAYNLATGERLVPADAPGHFTTLDGGRTFRLRHLQETAPPDAPGAPRRMTPAAE